MPDFDVVVVGAGSAGCALTSRLCLGPHLSVCFVEAGPDYGPVDSGRWPPELLDPRIMPLTHDWGYSEARPTGEVAPTPRARVIGGCSTHNQCGAVWGLPSDYDAWAAAGNLRWGSSDIAPLIDAVEKAEPPSPHRGRHGAVPTRPYAIEELAAWQSLFLSSAQAAGFPRLDDIGAPGPDDGVAPFHANAKDFVRWNAALAFLDGVRDHPDLTILDRSLAGKLIIERGRAVAVLCRSPKGEVELGARRFVLSAGAFGSPMVLMRSGVGPASHLRGLGIPVLLDLPGVGKNLHDHPGAGLAFDAGPLGERALREDLEAGRFDQSQVALRAKSPHSPGGFDLHLLPFQAPLEGGEWSFEILVFNMAPLSRGEVLLRGPGPELPPKIDFRYLTDPEDKDALVLVDGLRIARRLAGLKPLASAIAREASPGPGVKKPDELRAHLRRAVGGYAHAVGTCRMGPTSDPKAVVDPSGHVHGIDNVFVADASIMPRIPRANTNLTCFLIGLRIADNLVATL